MVKSKVKKPDQVVFNEETQQYDAAVKPYATSVGAPVISVPDTMAWKNRSIAKVNQKIQARYEELKSEYEQMMAEFDDNNLIYRSKFNFEPIIGEIYHVYKRTNGETFLSMIAPEECNFNSVGSYYLNADQIWQKI